MTTQTKAAAKSCATCTYYNSTSASSGECRRHSPRNVVFNVDASVKFESRFPTIKATDWCGEFAKR